MLGKLIKHEWKNTYKAGCLILLSLVAITFLGWLAFQSPMWSLSDKTYADYNFSLAVMDLVSIFTLLFYVIMLVAASLGILIYLALQFYRTMYSGEGYLTHTLPVTKHQLLVSKILVGGLWSFIVTVGIVLSIAALISFMVASALAGEYTVGEFWRMFFQEIGKLAKYIEIELDFELSLRLTIGIIDTVIRPFVMLTIVFGAISLGQLFTKHRVLMAIVCYIGVQMVSGLLESILQIMTSTFFVSRDMRYAVSGYLDVNSIVGYSVQLVLAVGMYLASYLVTRKKLNLE